MSAGARIARLGVRALTSLPGRIAVTAVLLALVARSIEWGTVGDALDGATWGWFALAVVVLVGSFVVAALRWLPLLHIAAVPSRLRESMRAYFAGAFANNLLPTGFGGDFVRAWIVAPSGRPLARALTAVAADRISALACLVVVGWIGIAIDPGAVPEKLVALLGLTTAAGVLLGALAVMLLRRRGLGRLVPERLRPWTAEVAAVLRRYGADHRLQARVVVLGIAFQALTVASMWCVAETIGLDLSPALLAVVTPLVLIATVAPISVAGFGVREGAFVVLLDDVGIGAGEATLLSLLSVTAMAIASLPGGVTMLVRHERPEPPPEALSPG